MIVIPAIDIMDGSCVRLTKGEFASKEIFGDPLAMAMRWKEEGAQLLHVIDLDGARNGRANAALIKKIACIMPIQAGGGIRSLNSAQAMLKSGIFRIILGTAALDKPDMIRQLASEFFSERICIAIDVRNGRIAIEGWSKTANIPPLELARRAERLGAGALLVTSINEDGRLAGPNLKLAKSLKRAVKLPLIYAGGIASLRDIEALSELGVYGAIIGKSLYKGNFTLKEAIECSQKG